MKITQTFTATMDQDELEKFIRKNVEQENPEYVVVGVDFERNYSGGRELIGSVNIALYPKAMV